MATEPPRDPQTRARADELLGPDNRKLLEYEVYGLAALYWPASEAQRALNVAKCESGLWTGAHATIGEDSRGLWQINVNAWPDLAHWNLYDPQINAYFAHTIWAAQGWRPWTCARTLGYA